MSPGPRLVWKSFHGAGGQFTIEDGDSFLEAVILPSVDLSGEFSDTARLRVAACIGREGLTGYVVHLWIAQSRRRQGLGTRMMEMAIDTFHRLGARSAVLRAIYTNPRDRDALLRFYRRLGFEAPPGCQEEADPYVTMMLPLQPAP